MVAGTVYSFEIIDFIGESSRADASFCEDSPLSSSDLSPRLPSFLISLVDEFVLTAFSIFSALFLLLFELV